MSIGRLYQGIKRAKRGANHSPQFSAEPKNVWSYTSTASDFMGHCLIKHKDHLMSLRQPKCVVGSCRDLLGGTVPVFTSFTEECAVQTVCRFTAALSRPTSSTSTCISLGATDLPRLLIFQVSIICCLIV